MTCRFYDSKQVSSSTYLEHLSTHDIYTKPKGVKLTGIICTIGPASQCVEILERLIYAGMGIARLNFSHGDYAYHCKTIQNVRQACSNITDKTGVPCIVAIALDTKGPEIRTGKLETGKDVELRQGEKVEITTDKKFAEKCTAKLIYVDYENITQVVEIGKRVYVDDGQISLVVDEIGATLKCTIENGGKLGNTKGINLPGVDTDLPALSEKDKSDLLFGLEQGIDMIFASFIRDAEALLEIRELLGERGKNIMVIPKIEAIQGVQNIDKIIRCSDGIMIARGDLGIEVPVQKVYTIQKNIVAKCNRRGKPVAVATQMLESMQENPRPTRAEVSDVFNAVLDGADCVMLSGESAKGLYPVKCVKLQAKTCKEAEQAVWYRQLFIDLCDETPTPYSPAHGAVHAAIIAAQKCCATAIIILSRTGTTAKILSRYRPCCPILMVTRDDQCARQSRFFRGIVPLHYREEILGDWLKDVEARILFALLYGKCVGIVCPGNKVVVVIGVIEGSGNINTMRILNIAKNVQDTVIMAGSYK